MRIATNAQEDPAIAVGSVQPRLRSVCAKQDYELLVAFEDGVQGVVSCKAMIFGARAGVFSKLRDRARFSAVSIEHGAVTWEGELDLAPDAMYDHIAAQGRWELA